MSRRLTRLSFLLCLVLSSEAWAIGLGDIKLDSALNEPLRAQIVLLSATPDELNDLTVALAPAETFERYGIDRPFFLQGIEFNIVPDGASGSVVQVRSRAPITEPFLTFLVEATWSSGRLLREYTVLLDPPTYAPPAVQQAPAVSAPSRTAPSDSGRIQRDPVPASPAPAAQPPRQAPQPSQPATTSDYDANDYTGTAEPLSDADADITKETLNTTPGGDVMIQKGDSLWGVAARTRPDSRLTMNQTMLAIYEANRSAFADNINVLRAGTTLRIPSADEIFQINRDDALLEVRRQNAERYGGDYAAPATDTSTRPSLVLVPPDEEPAGSEYTDDAAAYEPLTREEELQQLIDELEATELTEDQQSLIEIRNNDLARWRRELAEIRGEVYEPPVDETADEALAVDGEDAIDEVYADDEVPADGTDTMADEAADEEVADDVTSEPTAVVRPAQSKPGIVDQVMDFLKSWGWIIGVIILVAGILLWFLRRTSEDHDEPGPWETLDSDEIAAGAMSATESLQAPSKEESIVVVEQDSGVHPVLEDTIEAPASELGETAESGSGSFGSLEDTFSSETAVNLDQTDPIAEADFHMAYGLYDQAADLINGALESDPGDKGLMSKLCEIYFVWGNRDAFVDAATRLKMNVGEAESAEWDKIVIMGQQIAADHDMFAGAAVAGATKAVDLSFDDGGDETGALDMDFGADDSGGSDVIDLGGDDASDEGVDFLFDDTDSSSVDMNLEATAESPTIESPESEATAEMPQVESPPDDSAATVETPTIEEQFAGFGDGTAELPSIDETVGNAISDSGQDSSATAEINLDELDLDVDGLAETELASLDDLDATGQNYALSETGVNEALTDVTGKNPEIDPDSTGVRRAIDENDFVDMDATGEMRLAPDETGRSPMLDAESEQDATEIAFDDSLLDATGLTQVLSKDHAVDTTGDAATSLSDDDATMLASLNDDDTIENLPDDAATMLAPMDDDDDFDFAKTEALPAEAFASDDVSDETAQNPTIASTDVDLDLDDLTAALQVSEIGDTIEQPRDDATVEQPRPSMSESTAEVPTMALAPEEMSEDLHEARTMTEVGTKLDLARAYVDMGDPAGARSILEEVLDEGDAGQKQQAQQLLDSLPS